PGGSLGGAGSRGRLAAAGGGAAAGALGEAPGSAWHLGHSALPSAMLAQQDRQNTGRLRLRCPGGGGHGSIRNSGWPYSTGWLFSASTRMTRPATLDSISFISFIASMMQRTCPSLMTSPSPTYGPASGHHPP